MTDLERVEVCHQAIRLVVAMHGDQAEEIAVQMLIEGKTVEARWGRKGAKDAGPSGV